MAIKKSTNRATSPKGKMTLGQLEGVCLLRASAALIPGCIQNSSRIARAPRIMFSIVDTIFSFIRLYAQVSRFQVSRLKPGNYLWFLQMKRQVSAELASTDPELIFE
jgi:hypothetical protein